MSDAQLGGIGYRLSGIGFKVFHVVSVHMFRVQRSALPLATEVASLIKKSDAGLAQSHTRVRDKDKIEDPKSS